MTANVCKHTVLAAVYNVGSTQENRGLAICSNLEKRGIMAVIENEFTQMGVSEN